MWKKLLKWENSWHWLFSPLQMRTWNSHLILMKVHFRTLVFIRGMVREPPILVFMCTIYLLCLYFHLNYFSRPPCDVPQFIHNHCPFLLHSSTLCPSWRVKPLPKVVVAILYTQRWQQHATDGRPEGQEQECGKRTIESSHLPWISCIQTHCYSK